MAIDVVIVSWNTCQFLQKCLSSLENYVQNDIRTLVIDNGSLDGSVEMVKSKFPHVSIVLNNENVGFAKACNQGIQLTHSEYILLLNSDCEATDDFTRDLVKAMEDDSQIGVAGSVLLYPNGKIQKAGENMISMVKIIKEQILFSSSPVFSESYTEYKNLHACNAVDVDYMSGACMLIRRSALPVTGLLRDDFFMYAEDVEFCARMKSFNYRVVVSPGSHIIHYKSQSTRQNLFFALQKGIVNNCSLIKETQGAIAAVISLGSYAIGLTMRFVISWFRAQGNSWDWLKLMFNMPRMAKLVFATNAKHIPGYNING
jgi:GT2 family glycosyltransferase